MGSIILVLGNITTLQLFWFIFPGSGNKSVLLGHNKSDIALVVGMHWLNCLFVSTCCTLPNRYDHTYDFPNACYVTGRAIVIIFST